MNEETTYDRVVNDEEKAQDYARNSRFGRNPFDNVANYQNRHDDMDFDTYIEVFVCLKVRKVRKARQQD